jgi:hypothetical protein
MRQLTCSLATPKPLQATVQLQTYPTTNYQIRKTWLQNGTKKKKKKARMPYAWVIPGSCETHMTSHDCSPAKRNSMAICYTSEGNRQTADSQKACPASPLGLTPLTQRRGNKVGLCLCLGVDISLSYLLYYYYYSLLLFIVHHYYYSLLFILIFPLANGDRYSLAASQHVHVGYKPMINWHIEFAVSRARATQCMEVI